MVQYHISHLLRLFVTYPMHEWALIMHNTPRPIHLLSSLSALSLSLLQPSVLALAVLGCDLKLLGCDWLSAILSLQTFAQNKGGELSICYEAVAPHYSQIAAQYPLFIGIRRSAETTTTDHTAAEPVNADSAVRGERELSPVETTPPSMASTPLTTKCVKDTVATVCSSPVKAAA